MDVDKKALPNATFDKIIGENGELVGGAVNIGGRFLVYAKALKRKGHTDFKQIGICKESDIAEHFAAEVPSE
jgi:hypothetical protein